MITFREWDERKSKLEAMRRWLWGKEHEGKDAPKPVQPGDPDYSWVMKRLQKLGPLDPHTYKEM